MNLWIWGLLAALVLWVGWGVWARRRSTSSTALASHPSSQAEPSLAAYNPQNVGNDASARPWEAGVSAAPSEPEVPGLPEGFDADAFVQTSKAHFMALQAAWNTGDVTALRTMMTPAFLSAIQAKLSEREASSGQQVQVSDVLTLDAKLLAVEDMGDAHMASVEFNGMLRDEPGASPTPFREVWNITRPKDGGGWLVAGLQAMH